MTEKDKRIILVLIPVIVLILLVQFYFVVTNNNSEQNQTAQEPMVNMEAMYPVKDEEAQTEKTEKKEEDTLLSSKQNESADKEPAYGSQEYFEQLARKKNANNNFAYNQKTEKSNRQGMTFEMVNPEAQLQSNEISEAVKKQDMTAYMQELQREVKGNWNPPADKQRKKIVTRFQLDRDGSISNPTVYKSSGDSEADDIALNAIKSTSYKPLPEDFTKPFVEVQFTFDYNGVNASIRKGE